MTQVPRILSVLSLTLVACACLGESAEDSFRTGMGAYRAGDYRVAADAFRRSVQVRPASGALLNLGLAEWQRGAAGAAILAWEQSLWLYPFSHSVEENLRFARKTAQLEAPDLAWYEVVSSWLPANSWAWIAGLSLWSAIAIGTLPGILRLKRAAWHQAVAAIGLAVFLLSVPAHIGIHTRSRLGFVLEKDAPLRLTPTAEGQFITRLGSGEPARVEARRGNYLLIRTSRGRGWVERQTFRTISSSP